MYDPISVSTAVVSSNGDLLIELTDGNVINAGRVVGSPGPKGDRGEEGIRGAAGKDGIDGTNGAKWHTGVGAPDLDLGVNGDLYMDVASALLPIFQKVNGDWLFLANLKQPGGAGSGGGGSAAGDGGAIIIHPGPTPPIEDNTGRPIDIGDIWFDSETGLIWVWDGNVWAPVGDHPPVIISPTPPDYNSASDDNYEYPVQPGDLWFDSEQLALYVAAENQAGDLVWIISTPANRSGVTETVSNPFVFPVTTNGETVYNPTSDTWYVWNESKRQWIDVPTNCQTTDYVYKGEGTDPGEGEFKVGAGSTPELAEIYLFGDKRPFLEDGGYLFINDESHTIIYANYDSGTNTTVVAITPGLENLVVDESYNFSSCAPFIEKQEVYYGEEKPTVEVDNLEVGNIWIDKEDNKLYVWDGTAWSEVTACSATGVGEYLKKYGDNVDDAEEDVNYKWNKQLTFESDEDIITRTPWDIYDFSYEKFVTLEEGMWTEVTDWQNGYIVMECGSELYIFNDAIGMESGSAYLQAEYQTNRNLFGHRDRAVINGGFYGETHVSSNNEIVLGHYADPYNKQIVWIQCKDNKGYYTGLIEDNESLVNKQYVDAAVEVTQREIEVIQEEIEAIAPTTDKGIWQDGASATPGTGHFAMRRQGGQITQNYEDTDIDAIIISTLAKDGSVHSFLDANVGDLIQLFDVEDKNYGLFEIEVIDTLSSSDYVFFDVKWLQGLGETHVDDDVLVKVFAPPTGGTASEFLPLVGGTMTGEVVWNSTSAPYSGIRLQTSSSDPNVPDDDSGRIFYANMGGTFQQPRVSCGVPPTEPYSVVNKKYADGLLDFSKYQELS